MRTMMSFAALAFAGSIGGTALAAETTDRAEARDEAPVIEMKVDEDAVPEEEQRAEEDKDASDDETVEMTVEQPKPEPRETWMTGDTPATPKKD